VKVGFRPMSEPDAVRYARWANDGAEGEFLTSEERVLKAEEFLHRRVVAQDEAVTAVARNLRSNEAKVGKAKGPRGVFLFLGPTGVGKTELARATAEFVEGDEAKMVRIDMSEYMEKESVARLIGAPPGYVGFEQGGYLTEAVKKNPYATILLDEIEKAHPDVFNILLQVFEDGRLTDGRNNTIDFKHTRIFMTSNAGRQELSAATIRGFAPQRPLDSKAVYRSQKEKSIDYLRQLMKPELRNRIDATIVFHELTEDHKLTIARMQTEPHRLALRREHDLGLVVTDDALRFLLGAAKVEDQNGSLGARPVVRAIQRHVADELAEPLLRHELPRGGTIHVGATDGQLQMHYEYRNRAKKPILPREPR
jgi:ATP-dependent Clp protease ATP-binding subunit ClpC